MNGLRRLLIARGCAGILYHLAIAAWFFYPLIEDGCAPDGSCYPTTAWVVGLALMLSAPSVIPLTLGLVMRVSAGTGHQVTWILAWMYVVPFGVWNAYVLAHFWAHFNVFNNLDTPVVVDLSWTI